MKITDALRGEHALLYSQFARIEEAASREEDAGRVRGWVGLLQAAIVSHAQLEETLLFEQLEPRFGGGGPLEAMHEDHNQIEEALRVAAETEDVAEARQQLERAVGTARDHFAREEQMLFGMAERSLSDETLERLGQEWAEKRNVHLPMGR